MKKFNASQFTKFGFVHVADEDFTDDGNKFQIWMHEESGLKVTYSRYTYTEKGEKVTEYFISPRESYYEHGLLYDDVKDEPEYFASDKFNGCYEVDVEELVELLKSRHEMFLRVKAAVDDEEIDMTEVFERAHIEREAVYDCWKAAKNIGWWKLSEYAMKRAARSMNSLDKLYAKLTKVLNGEIDRRTQRELVARVKNYGYVEDKLEDGSQYSAYNELYELVGE